jgi:hypothetical protein
MTLDDADILLAQWAEWSSNELRKLGHSTAKWQIDYRSGFAEEAPVSEIPAGDEMTMLDVDTALAVLKAYNQAHYWVLHGRYVGRRSYTHIQLDSAKRAFIAEYQSPIDNALEPRLTSVRGRSYL